MLNVTGHDMPGVTSALFSCLPESMTIIDVEQVVVQGLLTLAVLVEVSAGVDVDHVVEHVSNNLKGMGIQVSSVIADNYVEVQNGNYLTITVLGGPLVASAMSQLAAQIAGTGANIDRIQRIAAYPVTALELTISGGDKAVLRKELAALSHVSGIDIAVYHGGIDRRGRQLVVMDVDSTVIQDEVVELLAAHAGAQAEVKRITEAAMAGELDFEESLRARVALLKGLPESIFENVFKELRLTPGARTLCRVLKSLDYHVALVSGGFTQVVEPLGKLLDVDHIRANELEVVDGFLTGRLVGEIVDRAGKAEALIHFAQMHGIPLSRTIAIGDGANDLDMLAAAGLGIAFNAKPVVRNAADAAVNVPYLDTVLYLLGITRQEIEDFDLQNGFDTSYPSV
jgi:phosphoserine phosphatase